VLSPGIFAFHLILVFSSHWVGGLARGATPLASGPRQCGQLRKASESVSLGAAHADAANNKAQQPIAAIFIGLPSGEFDRRHDVSTAGHQPTMSLAVLHTSIQASNMRSKTPYRLPALRLGAFA
jgi:hypothetical protein